MTEMLQKTENVAKNVANENLQDLTEQWKKGELPEGYYYVRDGENMIAEYLDGYFYNDGNPMTSFSGGVDEVLAPVPSYEEWKDLKSKLQLKDTAYDFDTARLEEQNAQLKELLKECREVLKLVQGETIYFPRTVDECIDKINEVLKCH